jgi:hypothetical protein
MQFLNLASPQLQYISYVNETDKYYIAVLAALATGTNFKMDKYYLAALGLLTSES